MAWTLAPPNYSTKRANYYFGLLRCFPLTHLCSKLTTDAHRDTVLSIQNTTPITGIVYRGYCAAIAFFNR